MTDPKQLISEMHQATCYENLPVSGEKLKESYPVYFDSVLDESKLIQLPDLKDFEPENNNFVDNLLKRRSLRRYDTGAVMSQAELSYLLMLTQGVREIDQKRELTYRFVPSAGSRHPFVTYLLIQNVEGLQAGIYHYVAQLHAIEPFDLSPKAIEKAYQATLRQKQVITSAVSFFWSVEVYRTSWRYSSRAYRYIHLDAGHVCQNLYLAAESIDYGVCAIAAFDDHLANEIFGLDEQERFVVYIASVGKKTDQ